MRSVGYKISRHRSRGNLQSSFRRDFTRPGPYTRGMPVAALVTDLIFGSKITGTASHVGVSVQTVRSEEALRIAVNTANGLVIDLNAGGDTVALVRDLRGAHPSLPIVGFASHVQTDLIKAARAAGCDHVLARSKFVEKLALILQRLDQGLTLRDADSRLTPEREAAED